VPPPPDGLTDLLRDWERFANEGAEMPLLVHNALLHSQVEMIRPFSTATDAFGRLLLVFCLVSRGRLPAPLLYRSAYLERNRQRYYAAVQSVLETATRAVDRDVLHRRQDPGERCHVARREDHRAARALPRDGGGDGNRDGVALVDPVCENPLVTTRSWRRGSA